jgi:hypothetical protein
MLLQETYLAAYECISWVKLSFCIIMQLSPMPWRCLGEWRNSSTILDISILWRWVVSFKPTSLKSWGKSLCIAYELEWSPKSVWRLWTTESSLPLPEIEPRRSIPSCYGTGYWYITLWDMKNKMSVNSERYSVLSVGELSSFEGSQAVLTSTRGNGRLQRNWSLKNWTSLWAEGKFGQSFTTFHLIFDRNVQRAEVGCEMRSKG